MILVSPFQEGSGMWIHAVYELTFWIPSVSLAQTNGTPMELCMQLPTKL